MPFGAKSMEKSDGYSEPNDARVSIDGEAENREFRKIQKDTSGKCSFVCNITNYGAKRLGFEKGELVAVETHADGILIRPVENRGDV